MKRNTTRWWVILAAVLAVYHVLIFAVPFPKNPVFFLSWAFTLVAIGAQVYVVRTAFCRGEGVKSKFYGWPIARIGALYLAAQLALGLAFMALGFALAVPLWLPLVLYAALLGAAAVGLVAADAMREEIARQDVRLEKDVACMRALQSKAASMTQLAPSGAVRQAVEQFAEALRFSDPVSGETLRDIEADLTACVDELHRALADGDPENALALVRKATALLTERNRLCKLDKRSAH